MNVSTTHDNPGGTGLSGNIIMELMVNDNISQTQTLINGENSANDGDGVMYCHPSCNMVALVELNSSNTVNGRITWTGTGSVWRYQTVYFSILQTSIG